MLCSFFSVFFSFLLLGQIVTMRVNILKNESKTNVLKLSFFGLFFFLAQAVSDDFDENYRKSYMINEFILMR